MKKPKPTMLTKWNPALLICKNLLLLGLILFLAGCTATASESLPYTLASEETQRGDLRVVGGSAELEQGSRLTGGVYMTHGSLVLGPQSTVGKDIVILSGTLQMEAGATVEGEVVMLSGRLAMEPQAEIAGGLTTGLLRVLRELAARLLRQVFLALCLPALIIAALVGLAAWWKQRKTRKPNEPAEEDGP